MKDDKNQIDDTIKLLQSIWDNLLPSREFINKMKGSLEKIEAKLEDSNKESNKILMEIRDDIKSMKKDMEDFSKTAKKFEYFVYFVSGLGIILALILKFGIK
ncbi:MAG: hypothetical protein KatS3mg068_1532 [Candidatus Sericytochromatia bacterium]|nr:MAG: hypothetical protein KatS3mg068_1532 [Candidatus Sericytochromatia bacterium]